MKRSTLIAIIVIFLSILVGGVLGFYFYINSSSTAREKFGDQAVNTGVFGTPGLDTSITVPGNASTTQPEQVPEITATTTSTTTPEIPLLRKIYSDPAAGMAYFSRDVYATTSAITESVIVANGTSSATSTRIIKPSQTRLIGREEIIHFVDRATGHIYETATSTLEIKKISNTTVPKVYEALFLNTIGSVLMRGLYNETDVIETKLGTQRLLTPTSTEKTLVIKSLPLDMTQTVLSPNKSKIFSLQNKKPIGVISNTDGTSAVTAFDSPFKEWLIAWPTTNLLTLTTKPTAFVEGYMYTVNPNNQSMQKVLGGIKGLTTLMSPNGQKVAFSESKSGAPNLYILNTVDGTVRNVFFRTFPEKCTWSNREVDTLFCAVPQNIAFGDYPDVWYQGLIFFSDDIWKINTRTGETRLIVSLNDLTSDSIDAINLTLSPNETYLMFNNKADLSLWGLQTITPPPPVPVTATSTASTTPAR